MGGNPAQAWCSASLMQKARQSLPGCPAERGLQPALHRFLSKTRPRVTGPSSLDGDCGSFPRWGAAGIARAALLISSPQPMRFSTLRLYHPILLSLIGIGPGGRSMLSLGQTVFAQVGKFYSGSSLACLSEKINRCTPLFKKLLGLNQLICFILSNVPLSSSVLKQKLWEIYNKITHMLGFLIAKICPPYYLVCWIHEWAKQMRLSIWKVLESTRV